MAIKVFISGPYSIAPQANTEQAIAWMNLLLDAGFVPFCPHLSHYPDIAQPRGYEAWLAYDLVWLESCDVLLRLPGESPGADREVAYARQHGIPVVAVVHDDKHHFPDVEATFGYLRLATTTVRETSTANNPALNVLQEADAVAGKIRSGEYGSPKVNHERIAAFWSVYLGHPVTASQVAMCMILLKVARYMAGPKRDTLVDVGGYAKCVAIIDGFEQDTTPHFTG
jgi:nucleoside 2-deoxyribosyltransferase